MARQTLGTKKHKKCEAAGNRPYVACLTRGGTEHFWALCWWHPHSGNTNSKDADWVNYKTGEVQPAFRFGRPVDQPRALTQDV